MSTLNFKILIKIEKVGRDNWKTQLRENKNYFAFTSLVKDVIMSCINLRT